MRKQRTIILPSTRLSMTPRKLTPGTKEAGSHCGPVYSASGSDILLSLSWPGPCTHKIRSRQIFRKSREVAERRRRSGAARPAPPPESIPGQNCGGGFGYKPRGIEQCSNEASQPASLPAEHSQSVCRRGLLQQVPPSLLLSALVSIYGSDSLAVFGSRRLFSHTLFRIAVATKVGPCRRANLAQAAQQRFRTFRPTTYPLDNRTAQKITRLSNTPRCSIFSWRSSQLF